MKCYKLNWKSGESEIIIANNLFQAGGFYVQYSDCYLYSLDSDYLTISEMSDVEIDSTTFINSDNEPPIRLRVFLSKTTEPTYVCGSMY